MNTGGEPCPKPITVLCVDDSADVVTALRALFGRESDMVPVAGVCDAAGFISITKALKPCVAVVDLTMPGPMTPIEAIRHVSEEVPETRVIAYSGYDDQEIKDLVIEAGAWGFVSKHAEHRALINAVRMVAAGQMAA